MRCTRNTLSNFRLSPFCLLSRSCQLQSTPSQQQSFTSRWPHCGRLLHDQQHRAAASFRMHSSRAHQVFLAFGSNLGNRLDNIHRALEELEHPPSPSTAAEPVVHILDTSFLYESLPMYYQDQGRFLNGVVKASTNLDPIQLLQHVKHVEHALGRRKTINNGPREVDLDILLYDHQKIHDTVHDLIVPHQRIAEREFVLRPLADLIPHHILPRFNETPQKLLQDLAGPSELTRVDPPPTASPNASHSHHHRDIEQQQQQKQVRPSVHILDGPKQGNNAPEHIQSHEVCSILVDTTAGQDNLKRREAAAAAARGIRTVVATSASSSTRAPSDWVYMGPEHWSDVAQWRLAREACQRSAAGEMVVALLDVRSCRDAAHVSRILSQATSHGLKRWQIVLLGARDEEGSASVAPSHLEWPWVFV